MVLENKLNITNQIELNKVEEKTSKEKAIKLLKDNRVNFALAADYREGKEIDCVVKTILNKIATDRDLEILRKREDRKKEGCGI